MALKNTALLPTVFLHLVIIHHLRVFLCLVRINSGYTFELTHAWQYFVYIISSITFLPCYYVHFYQA
jgi:hypothetical protein